jgi:leucyl-tRNA synthetase
MIFCHDGIWEKEKWPKSIVVNGSVLMEGQKMSKSLNNIIPLINAIENFGADPLRLSLMVTAEPLKDADFSPDLAKNMMEALNRFYERAIKVIKSEDGNSSQLKEIDNWMLSRLQYYIKDANEAMKEMKVRRTIHAAFYNLNQDLEWYLKRVDSDRNDRDRASSISFVEKKVLDTQVKMLTPFTPHLCEEIWEAMEKEGLVTFAKWPTADPGLVSKKSEELEDIIKNSVEDVLKIIRVTGIKPTKIHFYTADGWKWKIYMKALEIANKGELKVGNLIKEAFKDDEIKTRTKFVPNYCRTIVEDITKTPERTTQLRLRIGTVNETKLLQDAGSFLQNEFGCKVSVGGESDPWIEDPMRRANRAKPFRPAIYVE